MNFAAIGQIGPSTYPTNISFTRSLEQVNRFIPGKSTSSVMGDKTSEGGGSYYQSPFSQSKNKKAQDQIGEKLFVQA